MTVVSFPEVSVTFFELVELGKIPPIELDYSDSQKDTRSGHSQILDELSITTQSRRHESKTLAILTL